MGYWKFIPVSLCERDWSVLKIVWRDYFCIMLHIVLCSRIPDSVGKDIEKACQSIYPLHDVYVRKVKMLKKPKFECKWYTAMKLARTLDIFFLLLVGARDDKLFRSQMITWLLPIEISWPSLTRGEKKLFPITEEIFKKLCSVAVGKLMELHGEGGASSATKATGDDTGAKVERADGYEPPIQETV